MGDTGWKKICQRHYFLWKYDWETKVKGKQITTFLLTASEFWTRSIYYLINFCHLTLKKTIWAEEKRTSVQVTWGQIQGAAPRGGVPGCPGSPAHGTISLGPLPPPPCLGCCLAPAAKVGQSNLLLSRGVQPFGVSKPHWKKSCLGPHTKYIVT